MKLYYIYNIILINLYKMAADQIEQIDCHCTTSGNSECILKTGKCCWCSDGRKIRRIYIDEYGMLEPAMYHYPMPRDLYYCSNCRRPDTITVGAFTEELKNMLPTPDIFHGRITKEKNIERHQKTERIRQKQEKERYQDETFLRENRMRKEYERQKMLGECA